MKSVLPDRDWCSAKELAAQLGCDKSTVHRWIDRGIVKAFQLAPRCEVRIPVTEAERLLAELQRA